MKVGLIGGLLVGGLLGAAVLGLVPGMAMLGLGAVIAGSELVKEHKKERQAASWRAQYPSYKY